MSRGRWQGGVGRLRHTGRRLKAPEDETRDIRPEYPGEGTHDVSPDG